MDTQRFKGLTARQRALVAIAVLLDGRESGEYIEKDSVNGSGMKKAALFLASVEPEIRMPLVGTLLREALEET